jgi:hypothetical protein
VAVEELAFATWSNNRMIRFTDIYESVRRHRAGLDWDLLVESARSAGLRGATRTALALTGFLLGATAPEAVLAELDGDPPGRLRRWIAVSMVADLGADAASSPRRAFGKKLAALTPYGQVRLFRLVGLAELAFPGPAELRRRYDLRRSSAVAAVTVLRGCWSILRSFIAFASSTVARAALGTWRSGGRTHAFSSPLGVPPSPDGQTRNPLSPFPNE